MRRGPCPPMPTGDAIPRARQATPSSEDRRRPTPPSERRGARGEAATRASHREPVAAESVTSRPLQELKL